MRGGIIIGIPIATVFAQDTAATLTRGLWGPRRSGDCADSVAQHADADDLGFHDVAVLQQSGWLHGVADAGGRARADDIAWFQRQTLREAFDDGRAIEEQI